MRLPTLTTALLVSALAAGCGGPPRGPLLAGGREVKSWVADLQSSKARVRRQAVHKLGNVGDADPAVAPALAGALRDADGLVRHDAVLAVVKLKAPGDETVATLRVMAEKDKDVRARDPAGKALVKLGRAGLAGIGRANRAGK